MLRGRRSQRRSSFADASNGYRTRIPVLRSLASQVYLTVSDLAPPKSDGLPFCIHAPGAHGTIGIERPHLPPEEDPPCTGNVAGWWKSGGRDAEKSPKDFARNIRKVYKFQALSGTEAKIGSEGIRSDTRRHRTNDRNLGPGIPPESSFPRSRQVGRNGAGTRPPLQRLRWQQQRPIPRCDCPWIPRLLPWNET